MKPFNLEAALAGAPVVNFLGRKIDFLMVIPFETDQTIVAISEGQSSLFFEDGHFFRDRKDSCLDLFMGEEIETK